MQSYPWHTSAWGSGPWGNEQWSRSPPGQWPGEQQRESLHTNLKSELVRAKKDLELRTWELDEQTRRHVLTTSALQERKAELEKLRRQVDSLKDSKQKLEKLLQARDSKVKELEKIRSGLEQKAALVNASNRARDEALHELNELRRKGSGGSPSGVQHESHLAHVQGLGVEDRVLVWQMDAMMWKEQAELVQGEVTRWKEQASYYKQQYDNVKNAQFFKFSQRVALNKYFQRRHWEPLDNHEDIFPVLMKELRETLRVTQQKAIWKKRKTWLDQARTDRDQRQQEFIRKYQTIHAGTPDEYVAPRMCPRPRREPEWKLFRSTGVGTRSEPTPAMIRIRSEPAMTQPVQSPPGVHQTERHMEWWEAHTHHRR